jgi:anti-anti-sigma factor
MSAHDHAWTVSTSTMAAHDSADVQVRGRLGEAGAPELVAALTAASRSALRLRLDLEQVDYISSAGLKALADTAERLHQIGGGLELVAASECVKLALRLAGPVPHLSVSFPAI